MMYDKLLYFALATILAYGVHYLFMHIRKAKRQKATPEKATDSRAAMLCRYAGQQLSMNLMMFEAARELSAAAARQPKAKKSS